MSSIVRRRAAQEGSSQINRVRSPLAQRVDTDVLGRAGGAVPQLVSIFDVPGDAGRGEVGADDQQAAPVGDLEVRLGSRRAPVIVGQCHSLMPLVPVNTWHGMSPDRVLPARPAASRRRVNGDSGPQRLPPDLTDIATVIEAVRGM